MIYLQLFWTFFKIGLFNFGGGYAMISFIQNEVVYRHTWLTTTQFTDLVAVSQMTPGPVGINMATYTGYLAAGDVWGALIATGAVCLPSFLLMWMAAKWLLKHRQEPHVQAVLKGLRLGIVGLIAAAALVLCNRENFIDARSIGLFLFTLLLAGRWRVNPIWLIIGAGTCGWLLY